MDSSRPGYGQLRAGADVGGTFTDVATFDADTGQLRFGKTLTTPSRLVDGVESGVAKAQSSIADAGVFLHGTTIAINTLLERTGARTALLTARGFRDIYEIGRVNRPDAYNLFLKRHRPLSGRALLAAAGVPTDEQSAPLDIARVAAPEPGHRHAHGFPEPGHRAEDDYELRLQLSLARRCC